MLCWGPPPEIQSQRWVWGLRICIFASPQVDANDIWSIMVLQQFGDLDNYWLVKMAPHRRQRGGLLSPWVHWGQYSILRLYLFLTQNEDRHTSPFWSQPHLLSGIIHTWVPRILFTHIFRTAATSLENPVVNHFEQASSGVSLLRAYQGRTGYRMLTFGPSLA